MENDLPRKILKELRELYDSNPTGIISTWELSKKLNLPEKEVQGGLIYLKDKDMIKSFLIENEEWTQKISAEGIDELERLERSNQYETDEEPLEFDVIHEDHTGKIKVFISHKFVKSDQLLADTLQKYLDEKDIYGYIASRKRNYDLVFGEKIKNEINSSDYLIAIITKNSKFAPSIHQEIGYALGVNVPVRIMAEDHEAKGVLAEGKDIEKFSRNSFEKYLENIIKDIIKNGIRKKLTDKEREDLIQNVYEPCYNSMKSIFQQSKFFKVHENPWSNISHTWKLRTENDVKELFENYSNQLEEWRKMFVDVENDFLHKENQIADSITVAFGRVMLLTSKSDIYLDERTTMTVKNWVRNFRFVLFDPEITNANQLYENLIEYSRLTRDGHEKWLQRFHDRTDLFRYISRILPSIRNEFSSERVFKDLKIQHEKLKKSIEELTFALEEKLK